MSQPAFWIRALCSLCIALFYTTLQPRQLFAQERVAPVAVRNSEVLENYVADPDDSFRWELRERMKVSGCDVLRLHMQSQTWKEIPWKHVLYLIKPNDLEVSRSDAVMVVTGGSWKPEWPDNGPDKVSVRNEARLMAGVANEFGCVIAVLTTVPFQPIMDGKYEDEIIAETFKNYLETSDDTWPLLLPMVKSAVRGMDSSTAAAKKHWGVDLKEFTITGASKRGWTTWLTGAVDSRATLIAPMVIDMLNMEVQMKHQLEAWGKYSEQIGDYTRLNLPEYLKTEGGRRLQGIVDPFAYRAQIKQPKLLIFGTNDRYWPVDASNNYWDQLVGKKYMLQVPNEGHGIEDYVRVIGSICAFHNGFHEKSELPEFDWEFGETESRITLTVSASANVESIDSVRGWVAKLDSRDFRTARWKQNACRKAGKSEWTISIDKPESGHVALFGEVVTEGNAYPGFFSTSVQVY